MLNTVRRRVCGRQTHMAWDLLDGVQKLPECSFTGLTHQGVNLNPRGPPSMLQRKISCTLYLLKKIIKLLLQLEKGSWERKRDAK